MSDLAFELAAFAPWMEGGPQEDVSVSNMVAPDGSDLMLGRRPPDLSLGADGSVWFSRREGAVRVREGEPVVFALAVAEIDVLASLAPLADGGAVMYGLDATGESVLARLTDAGELAWRRSGPPPIRKGDAPAHLLADLDGSVYLHTADDRVWGSGPGEVLRLDPDDGALDGVLALEKLPWEVWVREGSFFWLTCIDWACSWVRHEIATGERRVVEASEGLRHLVSDARAPISGGGALLAVTGSEPALIWMGPDGEEAGRLDLAGIVRAGDGVAAAVREGDALSIARWSNCEALDPVRVEEPEFARLIYVEEGGYYVQGEGILRAVDAGGALRVVTTSLVEMNSLWWQWMGGVSLTKAVVAPDGSVLVAGSDREGAYAVRVTGAP